MLTIPAKIKLVIAAVSLVILLGGQFLVVREYYTTKHDSVILKIKEANSVAEKELQDKIIASERTLSHARHELETRNATAKKEITDLDKHYRNLIKQHGGLRDPGRPNQATGSVSGDTCTACDSRSCDSGRISDQTAEFLLDLTKEADELVQDYKSCIKWNEDVRRILHAPK